MTELHFRSRDIAYDIHIGRASLPHASRYFDLARKVLVITDEGVPPRYAQTLADSLPHASLLVLPRGEAAKSPEALSRILKTLLRLGFTRTDAIVAVGGGVVGDVSGFAAACYLRGITYYNIPTTLLSQVDSSIGGKTAINFGGVKNIVGAFHHPAGVLIDPDTLDTLDGRLFAEGLAEVVKMAATSDAELFSRIESAQDIRRDIGDIITAALRIKMAVVEADPEEKGLRAVLNFGHTVGHAVEAASGGRLYHGEAVAVGMLYMADGEARRRIRGILEKYGLPTSDDIPVETLLAYIRHDKKKSGDSVKTVRVSRIGQYSFCQTDLDGLRQRIVRTKETFA
ncbi:MAG: 3-dehydroquinate synthase [Bacteroidales bacterium]|nr:3-dehydroquinate synthase [Bacteroidales bacterium]